MDNSQLSSQGQDGTLAGGVGKLSSRSPDDGDHAGSIDNASRTFAMLSQSLHGVLTAIPNTLDVDVECEVSNILRDLLQVAIPRVHNSRVVKHHIQAALTIDRIDGIGHVSLLSDIDYASLNSTGCLGSGGFDSGKGGFEDVRLEMGHENGSTFKGEEDGSLEIDAAIGTIVLSSNSLKSDMISGMRLPSGACNDGVLSCKSASHGG